MSGKTDISIIVLTYNQEATIARTLDSLLNQITDSTYEIIIGDDGSTDGTSRICQDYAERYPDKIRYIKRDTNLGMAANYYDCVIKARGRFITDCSGDDFWIYPQKLQIQYELMQREKDVNLVSGQWICKKEDSPDTFKSPNAIPPGSYSGEIIVDLITNRKIVNLSSSLYRKEITEELFSKYPQLISGENLLYEDLQIILASASSGKIVVTPHDVLCYSLGRESVSNPKSYKQRFKYSCKTLKQTQELEKIFLKDPTSEEKEKLERFYRGKMDYISAMAFKTGPKEISGSELDFLFTAPSDWKGKIYKVFMINSTVWEITRAVYKKLSPSKFDERL